MSFNRLTYLPALFIDPPKIHTSLVWDLAVLFAALSGVYFLAIFILRSRMIKRNQKIRDLKLEIAPMISNFLFFEQDTNREEREEYICMKLDIRERLKDPASRLVMTQVLLDLRKDVSGDARERVFALYQDLGLDKDAFEKLRSWRWERVSQGILDLTEMRVDRAYPYIRKFINDRRSVIRKQAQLASVTLREEGITYFLDTAKYRISEWQQLKLLELLQRREDYDPPRFRAWLTSENSDVVLFALRLIRHYRQSDAEAGLLALLKHRKTEIKKASLECIRDFCFTSAKPVLKEVFHASSEENKILILDALAQVGEKSDLEFVSEIAATDNSFIVRSKAKSVMNSIAPDSALPEFARVGEKVEEPEDVCSEPVDAESIEAIEEEASQSEASKLETFEEETIEEEAFKLAELEVEVSDVNISEAEALALEVAEPEEVLAQEAIHPTLYDLDELLARADKEFSDEELEIFDVCLWEELDDILGELDPPEIQDYLPLDFLPIVKETTTLVPEKTKKEAEVKDWIDLTFLPEVVEEKEVSTQSPEKQSSSDDLLDIQFTPELEKDHQDALQPIFEWDSEILPPVIQESENNSNPRDLEVIYEIANVSSERLGVSIFQEYLDQYDTEAQLILLEEIPGVGGLKELVLLENLSQSADEPIRSKAEWAHDKLAKRLEKSANESNSESQ